MAKQIVNHYGLHCSEGIWFLHQGEGQVSSLYPGTESPFVVRQPLPCPHALTIERGVEYDLEGCRYSYAFEYDLFRAMLPIPAHDHRHIMIQLKMNQYGTLRRLSQLCGATSGVIETLPSGDLNSLHFKRQFLVSNIAPLVLIGVRSTAMPRLPDLFNVAAMGERRLILCTEEDVVPPPGFLLLENQMDSIEKYLGPEVPYRDIGCAALVSYMKGNYNDPRLKILA